MTGHAMPHAAEHVESLTLRTSVPPCEASWMLHGRLCYYLASPY